MADIRLEEVGHRYTDDWAVRPMTWTWRSGRAYALLGPSGCGKTTLLNIISGLLTPTQGRVYFDDRDVTSVPTAGRDIAQVFQFPVLYEEMSVYNNLAFPLRNRKYPRKEVDERVRRVASLLGLEEHLGRRARRLDAGRQQIVSLGRGLVRSGVAAVLLDEPLTVVDPALKWTLRSKLKEIHRDTGHTLIYVTHDQTEALTFADEVVVLKDGAIVQSGTPEELFLSPAHEFVGHFIGSPGMNMLPATVVDGEVRIGGACVGRAAGLPLPGERGAPGSTGTAGSVITGPVPGPRSAQAMPISAGPVRLGVRPEFVRLGGSGLSARVTGVDDLGAYLLVHAEVDGHALTAKTAPGAPVSGEHVRFERAFLFRDEVRIGEVVA
ncbi:ABC transporter ATP-binding protein [Nonomuraea soli]|uniref:Glycerol transport system ATP-binding protein n=1 Tax=Nonomuraea soli TaxID=1032476 RepID=A0A7W0CKM3_9ACTN|nr:ABC transporter ATP-binding protein [Nonomuraea soli]MBA2892875.1 glycerol transport system ATP-binding protein [Nonomuraea soli]